MEGFLCQSRRGEEGRNHSGQKRRKLQAGLQTSCQPVVPQGLAPLSQEQGYYLRFFLKRQEKSSIIKSSFSMTSLCISTPLLRLTQNKGEELLKHHRKPAGKCRGFLPVMQEVAEDNCAPPPAAVARAGGMWYNGSCFQSPGWRSRRTYCRANWRKTTR